MNKRTRIKRVPILWLIILSYFIWSFVNISKITLASTIPLPCDFFGYQGEAVILNNGDKIFAQDSDGIICGSCTVNIKGQYGFLTCKGDNPDTQVDEGAIEGDTITFFLNGNKLQNTGIWTEGGTVRVDFDTVGIINSLPVLEWIGEAGYDNSGVKPEIGYGDTDFVFKIKYIDIDGDSPSVYEIYLDKDGDGDYSDLGEVAQMEEIEGDDYRKGVIYMYTTKIPYSSESQNISYYFNFSDGKGFAAGNISKGINAETAINKPDISQTLSISIDKTSWELLGIKSGGEYILDNSNKILVTNKGDGNQTYSLKIVEEGDWSASSDKDGAGINKYVLNALFTGKDKTQIDASYFNEIENDDIVLFEEEGKASSTRFGSSQSPEKGNLVPHGAVRCLWFKFKAPKKDTIGRVQSIKISITAETP